MKIKDIEELCDRYGKDKTLEQVLRMRKGMRTYKCPACNGDGYIVEEYNGYPQGFPDSGFVYQAAYRDVECKVCDGEGWTKVKYAPKYVQEGFEISNES